MKLYIREKVFSWGDKFTVKDQYGNDKYIVQGEVFSFGKINHCLFRICPATIFQRNRLIIDK